MLEVAVRLIRDQLLEANVDSLSNKLLQWEAMSADEKKLWTDYRKALLDITDQAGFPTDITWPTKPE